MSCVPPLPLPVPPSPLFARLRRCYIPLTCCLFVPVLLFYPSCYALRGSSIDAQAFQRRGFQGDDDVATGGQMRTVYRAPPPPCPLLYASYRMLNMHWHAVVRRPRLFSHTAGCRASMGAAGTLLRTSGSRPSSVAVL